MTDNLLLSSIVEQTYVLQQDSKSYFPKLFELNKIAFEATLVRPDHRNLYLRHNWMHHIYINYDTHNSDVII